MDEKQLAAEATGAAVALAAAYRVLRWFWPKKNGVEPSLRIGIRQMLCTMDKKLDSILGRLDRHDTRFDNQDRRELDLQGQLTNHIAQEDMVQREQNRKLDCLMRQKGE